MVVPSNAVLTPYTPLSAVIKYLKDDKIVTMRLWDQTEALKIWKRGVGNVCGRYTNQAKAHTNGQQMENHSINGSGVTSERYNSDDDNEKITSSQRWTLDKKCPNLARCSYLYEST